MHFPGLANALAALLLQPAGASSAAGIVDYVILGDEARRTRLEGALAPPAAQRRYRPSAQSGMGYVGCITAWRHDRQQRAACIASRLARRSAVPTIVLDTYDDSPARGGVALICHGSGGTGRAVLTARPVGRDPAALEECMAAALAAPARSAPRPRVGVGFEPFLEAADRGRARSGAARVLLVAVDHVGIPRGTIGHCLIQGRLVEQERGSGLAPGALVEAGVPCAAHRRSDRDGERRIAMGEFRHGMFARLYLDGRNRLADFERVEPPVAGTLR